MLSHTQNIANVDINESLLSRKGEVICPHFCIIDKSCNVDCMCLNLLLFKMNQEYAQKIGWKVLSVLNIWRNLRFLEKIRFGPFIIMDIDLLSYDFAGNLRAHSSLFISNLTSNLWLREITVQWGFIHFYRGSLVVDFLMSLYSFPHSIWT